MSKIKPIKRDLYKNQCLICSTKTEFKNEISVTKILTEREKNLFFEMVYLGVYNPFNLPEQIYLNTGWNFTDAILKGWGLKDSDVRYMKTDTRKFFDALRDNAFKFSGAKTFDQVLTMSNELTDENGNVRSFKEFRTIADDIFEKYNVNYLKTEYETAISTSQMAKSWTDFEQNKDLFPLLEYNTAGDLLVRKEHEKLDGIIQPVESTFWDTYFPPNGWKCRCDVIQLSDLDSEIVTTINKKELPELEPEFQVNFGKNKILFSPEHPYFIVDQQFETLKENNFNLPPAPEI